MKLIGWLFITVFLVLGGWGQVWAADNSRIAWNNSGWGNTDWGNTDWRNTDWGNTDWVNNVQIPQNEKPKEQLMKVTLGIKKPDGFCAMVVTWADSSGEAINAVAKNCQGCIIDNLGNSDNPGDEAANIERFCQ